MLHRTEVLPPHDDSGVSIEAAFLGVATTMRLLDVIKVGDWLLHRHHLDLARLRALMTRDDWRPGSATVEQALPHLEKRSRSLIESEGRIFLVFAGLPRPVSNLDVYENHEFLGCGDLTMPDLSMVVEIEGRQHALDMQQFHHDIDRYARFRDADWGYVQATARHLSRPKSYVLNVFRVMRRRGYDGPAPVFDDRWDSLFLPPRYELPRR